MKRLKASFVGNPFSLIYLLGLLQNWHWLGFVLSELFTDSFNHSLKSVVLAPETTHLFLASIFFIGIAVLVAETLLSDSFEKTISYRMCVKVYLPGFTLKEFSKYSVKPEILIFCNFS